MDLDLIDCRHHRTAIEERREVLDHEVADPYCADHAVSEQTLQRAVCPQRSVERRRQRLVKDQQVDLADAELAGALLEAVQSFVIPVVTDPDLRLQEDLRPTEAGVVHSIADLALVAIGRRGVDEAVAGTECGPNSIARLIRGRLEHAKTERGHLDAVVEGNCLHGIYSRNEGLT